jgi:hypothetical protein
MSNDDKGRVSIKLIERVYFRDGCVVLTIEGYEYLKRQDDRVHGLVVEREGHIKKAREDALKIEDQSNRIKEMDSVGTGK